MHGIQFGFDQDTFNSRCLSFYVLTHKAEPGLGFSYWLEGGSIQYFGTSAGRAEPIYLRDNQQLGLHDREQLESWEPMTSRKLGLIALQLHVVGDERTAPWAPEPFLTAVTVSPQGFVFKGIDNDVYVSDVRTLATSDDPFDDGDVWTLYSLDEKTGEIKPPHTQPPVVQIGGGALPVPEKDLWHFDAGSLTAFGENTVLPLERAGNHITDELTDETRGFVYQHLGVDVSHVDWGSAHMHRLINAEYGNPAKSANVVPFSPQKALRALQNAVNATAKKIRTNPALRTLSPEHGQAGGYQAPSDKPTR